MNRAVNYGSDPVGNRQQVQNNVGTNSVSTGYSSNALNQYTLVGADVPTYDANGNLTGQNGWSYTFDAQNRLISAVSTSVIATFAYDARNRCVARSINGTVSYLTYDSWNLIEERDASGTILDKYVHGANIDEILVRYNSGAVYYHHDGLGSVTHLTDATGSVVESYQYDVYGTPAFFDSAGNPQLSSLVAQRFLFTGREYLAELGLYDYRNRIYSPALGRFLQTDPIRFKAVDINLYRYVLNTPVGLLDALGLDPVLLHALPSVTQYSLGDRITRACRNLEHTETAGPAPTSSQSTSNPLLVPIGEGLPTNLGTLTVTRTTHTVSITDTWIYGTCGYVVARCGAGCCWQYQDFTQDYDMQPVIARTRFVTRTEYSTSFSPSWNDISQDASLWAAKQLLRR